MSTASMSRSWHLYPDHLTSEPKPLISELSSCQQTPQEILLVSFLGLCTCPSLIFPTCCQKLIHTNSFSPYYGHAHLSDFQLVAAEPSSLRASAGCRNACCLCWWGTGCAGNRCSTCPLEPLLLEAEGVGIWSQVRSLGARKFCGLFQPRSNQLHRRALKCLSKKAW